MRPTTVQSVKRRWFDMSEADNEDHESTMNEHNETTTDDEQPENYFDEREIFLSIMDSGVHDPFSDFADEVTDAMAATGNKVGRPCVMKVTIEVKPRL